MVRARRAQLVNWFAAAVRLIVSPRLPSSPPPPASSLPPPSLPAALPHTAHLHHSHSPTLTHTHARTTPCESPARPFRLVPTLTRFHHSGAPLCPKHSVSHTESIRTSRDPADAYPPPVLSPSLSPRSSLSISRRPLPRLRAATLPRQAVWEQGDEDPHAGAGCGGQDEYVPPRTLARLTGSNRARELTRYSQPSCTSSSSTRASRPSRQSDSMSRQ